VEHSDLKPWIDTQVHAQLRVDRFNAAYARCIDGDRLEAWPGFFLQECLYTVTSEDNHRRGYVGGIIYADSIGMLKDRVSGLREANIYERHSYRHLIGPASVLGLDGDAIDAEAPFVVYRIMRTGLTELFVTGRYVDRLVAGDDGELRLRERRVVCDSNTIDTLLAIPL
jgi:3-phenylpropionate/cinnamic acid dioxygenase small subunit